MTNPASATLRFETLSRPCSVARSPRLLSALAGFAFAGLAGLSLAHADTPPASPVPTTTPAANIPESLPPSSGVTITTIPSPPALPSTSAVPPVQIAILLDTSGSMQGLVNQARAAIWDIVNTMSKARKNGQIPQLQVALYQYGSNKLPSSEGFLRMMLPFTSDLDLISQRLFELEIDGSEEYCGQVMDAAVKQLQWSPTSPSAPLSQLPLRMIVIAGNEPFTQGPIDYRKPIELAVSQGILINTIHCGNYREGESTGWLDGAYRGKGAYNVIDQSQRIDEPVTPFDAEISRLNDELNATYVWYGSTGRGRAELQSAQDTNAGYIAPSVRVSRSVAKSSASYSNSGWDLIDARKEGKIRIEDVPTADLPEQLREMTLQQREEYIDSMSRKRDEIRAKIAQLAIKRNEFLREHRSKANSDRFDQVIVRAIRKQAEAMGYTFSPD